MRFSSRNDTVASTSGTVAIPLGTRRHETATDLLAAIAIAVVWIATPTLATAQTCDPGAYNINGTAVIGDGSQPVVPAVDVHGHLEGGGYSTTNGLPWGSFSVPVGAPPAPGSYTFTAGNPNYFQPPYTAGANCSVGTNGCISCQGSFSVTLYSTQGAVYGTVTCMPSGGPAVGASVGAHLNGVCGSSGSFTTGLDGKYDSRLTEPTDNNWGIPVFGGGGGPGTATYLMTADTCEDGVLAIPGSNIAVAADLVKWGCIEPADPPEPSRPPCQGGGAPPPPSNTGRPVNVMTGNVWFDHTDAVMPGRGEGLRFVRSYNSSVAYRNISGSFGRGWTHTYERSLSFPTGALRLRQENGTPIYFEDWDSDLTYKASAPITETSWIVKSGTTYTRYFRAGGSESYDSAGRLTSIVDPAGNTTTLTRDGAGQLLSVSDGNRTMTLGYDGSGRITSLLGPLGLIASYSYDTANQLWQVSYPDGSGYAFTYDESGQVLTVMDASGRLLERHSYSSGKGVTDELADGQEKVTLAYNGLKTTVTNALGNETVYEFTNIRGIRYVTKITGPCSGCGGGTGETQEWTYDGDGRILTRKDGSGNVTTYTYDANGNLESETNELDQTTTHTYDSAGRVLTTSRPGGGLTTLTHGSAGPLTITEKVDATTNRTTTLTYTSAGKPQTITDPRGKTTTLAYSTAGDLTSVTDPLTHATTFGYDSMGRRTTVTDALSNTTTTTYNPRGRVTRITSPDTTHTDFAYDLGGRRTSVTDPLGRTTNYAYDPYGRLESVVDPANGTTTYAYDLMSNLISLTDAKDQTTSFEYDGYNRVKKVIYPGGAYETFTYDAGGRLSTRVDRKNVTTTYSYDELNRLMAKTYSDGTTPAVSYTYNTTGQLATAANGTDTLTWTYDLAGQLLTEQSTNNSSTVAYTYDLGGNRLSLSLDGTVFVTYAYDDASRLTTISRGANNFTFGYDNANRRTSLGYPNGVNTTYTYDTLSRLTNLTAALSGTTVTSSAYTYDAAGNRLSKTHPDYAESYVYDALYRLKEVNRTGLTKHWIYTYDPVGNRLSEQVDNTVSTYAYNEKNQLLSTTGGGPLRFRGTLNEPGMVTVNGQAAQMLAGNAFEAYVNVPTVPTTVPVVATDTSGNATTKNYQVTGAGSAATYTYDTNGNLTQKVEGSDTWTYEWNAENQLTRVLTNGSEVARYKYDPWGRRVERLAAGTATLWTYDAEDSVREIAAATVAKYVNGPTTDEPLAQEDGSGGLSPIHADALGSVVRTTNAVGTASTSRRYDAFGNIEVGTSSGVAFTGREWDSAAGLAYYRARYYDPAIGRFISQDPLRWATDPNFYAYVRNNPARYTDASGLRIGGQVIVTPPVMVPQTTCGTDGCTTTWTTASWDRACQRRSGTFSFDADVYVTIGQEFSMNPNVGSIESPWTSLSGHEDRHKDDFTAGASDDALNGAIQSDRFPTRRACECARRNFLKSLQDYWDQVIESSHILRDLSESAGMVWPRP